MSVWGGGKKSLMLVKILSYKLRDEKYGAEKQKINSCVSSHISDARIGCSDNKKFWKIVSIFYSGQQWVQLIIFLLFS